MSEWLHKQQLLGPAAQCVHKHMYAADAVM